MAIVLPRTAIVLLAACGRVDFDARESDLAIDPVEARSNPGGRIAFTASGGLPPYAFRVRSGTGWVDPDAGRYTASAAIGIEEVEVRDRFGDTRVAHVTVDASTLWYAGGSTGASAGVGHVEVWRSDDGAATWTLVGQLPYEIQLGAAAVYDDQLWLIGGYAGGDYGRTEVYSSYDGGTWQLRAALPVGCPLEPSAAVFRGRLWVIRGGCVVSGDGDTWRIDGTLDYDTHEGVVLSFGGQLIYAGGHNSVERHDLVWASPDGAAFATIGRLPSPRNHHGMTVFAGRMWVAGGLADSGVLADTAASDDGATWTQLASLPAPRRDIALVAAAGRVYLLGGQDDAATYATDDGTSWIHVGDLPAQRSAGFAFAFDP